jgi:hypothetical protein
VRLLRNLPLGIFVGFLLWLFIWSWIESLRGLPDESKFLMVEERLRIFAWVLDESSQDYLTTQTIFPPLDDPFSKRDAYRLKVRNRDLVIYSIGPDREDNGASFPYDPTNGTNSAGDIIKVLRHIEPSKRSNKIR